MADIISISAIISLIFSFGQTQILVPQGVNEYCEREDFKASCAQNEIILMRMAVYGRMRVGRCVKKNYGSELGCQADVFDRLDQLCSGKRECTFPVTTLHDTRPCTEELLAFLLAEYSCVEVSTCTSRMCDSGAPLQVLPPAGYLASLVTSENGCGASNCPWTVQPLPGQRLNLTFHNYVTRPDSMCIKLATLYEKNTDVSTDVDFCGSTRVMSFMTSVSTAIEVRMRVQNRVDPDAWDQRFIMHYHAVGCSEPQVPSGGFSRKENNATVIIGCHGDESLTWRLMCIDGNWVGNVGTCDHPLGNAGQENQHERVASPAGGLLVVIGVGVALGVILGFAMLSVAIIYMKRRQTNREYHRRDSFMASSDVIASQDKMASGKLYDAHSPRNHEKLLTPDSVTYSTYHMGRGTPQRTTTDIQAHGKAVPVPVPDTPCLSTLYYGGQGPDMVGLTPSLSHHRDHVYEYPTFGAPPSCSRQNSSDQRGTGRMNATQAPNALV